MKFIVASVGHKMPGWISDGFNEYAKRMPREAKIDLLEIKPEPRSGGKATGQIMEAEAQRINTALPAGCLRIALDERGANWTTRQLADRMRQWMGEGRDIAFIIGGAELYAQTLPRADRLYLTWVHGRFDGDAWFPEVDFSAWRELERHDHAADPENPFPYSFVIYTQATDVVE